MPFFWLQNQYEMKESIILFTQMKLKNKTQVRQFMSWWPYWKPVQSSENQSWKKPVQSIFPTKAGQGEL